MLCYCVIYNTLIQLQLYILYFVQQTPVPPGFTFLNYNNPQKSLE